MKWIILSAILLALGIIPTVYAQMDGNRAVGNKNEFSIARIKWGGGGGWFYNPSWSHDYPVA